MENNTSLVLANLNDNVQILAKIALINLPDNTPMAKAEKIVMKEIVNFEMICMMKPELANLDKQSIFIAVKQCIADNLTLSPNAGLVYLSPGRVCVGIENNQKVYKDVLVYEPTSEGRISIARQAGTLLDHKRPTVAFDSTGKVSSVTFEFLVNALPKPRWEIVKFDTNDFERWRIKSEIKNNGKANANYTSFKGGIDPEFARAKAIKHGLKKRGTNKNEVRSFSDAPIEPIENVEKSTTKVEESTFLHERIDVIKKETGIEEATVLETQQTQQTQLDLPSNNDLF